MRDNPVEFQCVDTFRSVEQQPDPGLGWFRSGCRADPARYKLK